MLSLFVNDLSIFQPEAYMNESAYLIHVFYANILWAIITGNINSTSIVHVLHISGFHLINAFFKIFFRPWWLVYKSINLGSPLAYTKPYRHNFTVIDTSFFFHQLYIYIRYNFKLHVLDSLLTLNCFCTFTWQFATIFFPWYIRLR